MNFRAAPPNPPTMRMLPYRKPTPGRDYWVIDDVLPDPDAVRTRTLARTDWIEGFPFRQESWPGMRVIPGLQPEELAIVETKVKQATGMKKLWTTETGDENVRLNHNCIQVVGIDECGPRPHTDSRTLCRFAAVLYLNPDVPEHCGTAFYRQRMPTGQDGGNIAPPPNNNLTDALGTRFVAPDSFTRDITIPYRYNSLLVYHSNLIHSATGYWGDTVETKRMAAVFFWMGS